jgi:hypothetical protein
MDYIISYGRAIILIYIEVPDCSEKTGPYIMSLEIYQSKYFLVDD